MGGSVPSAPLNRCSTLTGAACAATVIASPRTEFSNDTLGGLARQTGLEQSTLSRNLTTLERQGLIEITAVETDLRRRAVWLTETGARRLEAAIPVWRKAQTKLVKHLSSDIVQQLAVEARALYIR